MFGRLWGWLAFGALLAVVTGGWLWSSKTHRRLRRSFRDAGVGRRHQEAIEPPLYRGRVTRLRGRMVTRWQLPPGISLRDVLDRQSAVEERCLAELSCWMDSGLLHVEEFRHRIPEHVPFASTRAAQPAGVTFGILAGMARRGPMWIDLATTPHLLIGGMTGGGKSVFLRQAVTQLALRHGPEDVAFACIDLKRGVELGAFAGLPHALFPLAEDVHGAAVVLDAVRAELDDRLGAMRRHGLRDVVGWNASGRSRWPRVLVIVDELAELTVRELGEDRAARDAQRAAIGRLCEIARLGRAAGVHLIACTQRPDAEAVPGQLKANLSGTIAFRVRSKVNSQILLDSDRATLLPPRPGRGLWAHERIEEFQSVYLGADEMVDRLQGLGGEVHDADTAVHVTPRYQTTPLNTGEPMSPRGLHGRINPRRKLPR